MMKRRIGTLDTYSVEDLGRVRKVSGFFKELFRDEEKEELKRLTELKWDKRLDKCNHALFAELGVSRQRLKKILQILDDEGVIK